MTNDFEQAIYQLERYGNCHSWGIEPECVELALSALREQAERNKGCKNCTAGDGAFAVKCEKWNDDDFCPKCGRRLDKRRESEAT